MKGIEYERQKEMIVKIKEIDGKGVFIKNFHFILKIDQILKKQMKEKRDKSEEAYQQYLRERDQADQIIQKIVEEDLRSNYLRNGY